MPSSLTIAFFTFALFVATALAVGVNSTAVFAQGKDAGTAVIRLAYTQVFTDPQDSTCPNPRHRKVKTSKGYRWRWVC
ncbi:MAG: hypothetical protein WA820_24815 [Bradyrhizobium sp.]|jgi:hypothetical protein